MEFASCSHQTGVVKPLWHKLCYVSIKDPAVILWFVSVKKDKPHISETNLIPSSIYVSKRFPWQYIKLKEESFRKKHINNVIPHLGLCLNYIYSILTFCPGSSGKFFFFPPFKKKPTSFPEGNQSSRAFLSLSLLYPTTGTMFFA